MFTKIQLQEILSISEGTITNLPGFPAKIDSKILGNRVLYSKKEVYIWMIEVFNRRKGCTPYEGDIEKERIIRVRELSQLLKISKSHIYNQVQKGLLPPLVQLGERTSGFLLSEVNAVLYDNGLPQIN